MQITRVSPPDSNIVARGEYLGGPAYEFFAADDGHIAYRVVGDRQAIWAGPDVCRFLKIIAVWHRCQAEVSHLLTEEEQLRRVAEIRREMSALGALPTDLPHDPEPLWSLLLFEAEAGLS